MRNPKRTRVIGPLAAYRDGFADELARIGYTPDDAQHQMLLLAHLSRWLDARDLGARDIIPDLTDEFLGDRRADGYRLRITERGLRPLLDYLRGLGVVESPSSAPSTPFERVIEEYRQYLIVVRNLADQTILAYVPTARLFLVRLEQEGRTELEHLTAGEVRSFVVEECRGRQTATVFVVGLRSFLRFLFASGYIRNQLACVVPTPAGFSGGSLPRALPPETVQSLLSSCDRSIGIGRRDFAVLTLLARLGLRAGEVAGLTLDDIDWRHGEITVRGKGGRCDRLPLPTDVGDAVVAYIEEGRPLTTSCRAVFLRAVAPSGALDNRGVGNIVHRAARRAGLSSAGPHRLRHSAATAMLAGGASLTEVGQVLRQVRTSTTAIYAKVDRNALREIAQPWPEGLA